MNDDIFCEKLELYKDTVFRIAYSYLKNISDAEDVCQDVFLKFYTYEKSFADNGEEKAWLIRITINKCKDMLKSSWKNTRTDLDECRLTYSMNEAQQELLETVMSIPEKYRIIIHLYYYEQYPIKDIAQITGRKISTVQTQLQRARKLIEKKLKEEEEYEQKFIHSDI
ncbi:RNA polymerase sigma factor [Porcipelethomonas sp.]|uniref:RNA polymerase sigma factor n=1 Tax=Porcipelethomonas sp. TaxID=2981675 RepID=UPI003EFAF8D5